MAQELKMRVNVLSAVLVISLLVSTFGLVGIASAATPQIDITVDTATTTLVNDYATGFMLDLEWKDWRDSSTSFTLTKDAGFKLVRIIDFKSTSPRPCTKWSESTKTGTFDWTGTDKLVKQIVAAGAEPLVTLGSFSGYNTKPKLPSGMAVNSATGLPNPESFAAYCVAWLKHFKGLGITIKYWEIINEAWYYFFKSWGVASSTKLSNYVKLLNTVSTRMHDVDTKALIGTDSSTFRCFLDYYVKNGQGLGFFSLHKYESGSTSTSDSTILSEVETRGFETTSSMYSPSQAQTIWRNAHGATLPVIITETNLSYMWTSGSDPRIQKVVGAVWTALMIRTCVLKGVKYSSYYSFSSSKSSETQKSTHGYGFGMVNNDDYKPWYPYYVQKMIGANLVVGDRIVKTTSSSADIRPIAWIHSSKLYLLIICKVNTAKNILLHGVSGSLALSKVDNAVSYQTPRVQTGTVDSTKIISLIGYTVMLLQKP